MPATTLPNGLTVQHISKQDLQFLFEEVFEQNCYLRHGVQLQRGDVVLDIGSNIGMFSMASAAAVGPEGLVFSAEPLPQLHKAQSQNIETHRQWCKQRGVHPAPVRLLQTGVGDGSAQQATFTLYTEAAGWSSMQPDDAEVEANMGVFLRRSLASGAGIAPGWAAWAGRLLQSLAPAWLFDWGWRWYVRRMLRARQEVACSMCTVSDIMSSHQLKRVDLLKIDVERAELAVLRGVALKDWPRIKQVSMEVHDSGGRLPEVLRILREDVNFDICVVEQSDMLKGSSLYNIYCTRTQ